MYEKNNRILAQSMKTVQQSDQKANSKFASTDWRAEKKKLTDNFNDILEEKEDNKAAHDRKTKALNSEIESLKAELESLKAVKEE